MTLYESVLENMGLSKTFKLLNKFVFFLYGRRMSRKNIIFDDNKNNKSNFCKNKKLIQIDHTDYNKILIYKRASYDEKTHLNVFLDIMTMMTLQHYA